VGCSGGGDTTLGLPAVLAEASSPEEDKRIAVEVSLGGCSGGHSGIDIHKGRCNAVAELAGLAKTMMLGNEEDVSLARFEGGDKRNAIPREARATFLVAETSLEKFREAVAKIGDGLATAFAETDPDLEVNVSTLPDDEDDLKPLARDCALRLAALVSEDLPRGALAFSADVPGLVETSNNVAAVKIDDDGNFVVTCSTRSSVTAELETVRDRLAAAAEKAGGSVLTRPPAYPGWKPNMKSRALELARRKYEARSPDGAKAEIKAIHAGLECGLLIEKIDADLDCVSFGPTILEAHTPDEMVRIDSVGPFFTLLTDILDDLAAESKE